MSKLLKKLQAEVVDNLDIMEDMHEEAVGPKYEKLPLGDILLRLVGYVEVGTQEGKDDKGNPKPIQDAFRLVFQTYPMDPDADPSPYMYNDRFRTETTWPNTLSRNAKSNAFKWFTRMDYTGKHKSFAQLLDVLYMTQIVKSPKGAHSVDMQQLVPAMDRRTRKFYDAPEAEDGDYKLFLWNAPTMQQWGSLYNVDKDGNKVQSYLQRQILGAKNFEGSPIQTLLSEGGALESELEALHKVDQERKKRKDEPSEDAPEVEKPKAKPIARKPSIGKVAKVAIPEDDTDDFDE